jgi:ribosomal protein L37AE/L43A
MAINQIQFQAGLSVREFFERYGTEARCDAALAAARWPQGWRCARCGCSRSFRTQNRTGRPLWDCFVCGYQSPVTVGTVFEHTKLPLSVWFLAIHLMTQSRNAVSAGVAPAVGGVVQDGLAAQAQVAGDDAPARAATALAGARGDRRCVSGRRACRGHAHGGRGALDKKAFVAAVQTDKAGHTRFMRLTPVAGFTNEAIKAWSATALAPGAHVVSDGTACFARVTLLGASHERHVTGSGRQAAQLPQFKWVNTLLGNLKTALSGTYHSFDHAKYAARYLAEFAYRFNRRFDLAAMVPRLLRAAALTKPLPLKSLQWSEACT